LIPKSASETPPTIEFLGKAHSRGLVTRAIDWKWSSASWYLLDPPGQQLAGLPFIHVCRWEASIELERTLHWQSQWHPALKRMLKKL
jgi:hypothetical protein